MSYNKRWEVPNGGSYGNLDVRNIAPVGWVGGICQFGQIQFMYNKNTNTHETLDICSYGNLDVRNIAALGRAGGGRSGGCVECGADRRR